MWPPRALASSRRASRRLYFVLGSFVAIFSKQTKPLHLLPKYIALEGIERLPDGAKIYFRTGGEGNIEVRIIADGNSYFRVCEAKRGLCSIFVPVPEEGAKIEVMAGFLAEEIELPPLGGVKIMSVDLPPSFEVNVEAKIDVNLCNFEGKESSDVLCVYLDSEKVYEGSVVVPPKECTVKSPSFVPREEGEHTLSVATYASASEFNIFVGYYRIPWATSGGSYTFLFTKSAISGGGWTCPNELNCYLT